MKKTKLFTSIAALALVLGLGACETTSEESTPEESEGTSQSSETTTEGSGTTEGEEGDTSSTENPGGGNEGGEENEEVFSGTYKLGALDGEYEYCHNYFDGKTKSSKLTTTSNWEEAVDVTIELDESALETLDDGDELTGTPYTLSFINADGSTKYISWSSSTNVDIKDTPYTWYWVDSIEGFAAGSTSGRVLVYYASGSDIRAYAQTETNLAYPHVYPYTEAKENPKAPEVSGTYNQVDSLDSCEKVYAGGYSSSNTLFLTTGSLSSNNLLTSRDLDACTPLTITSANDGYTLTLSDGEYVYAYATSSNSSYNLYFDKSSETTVPKSGTNVFKWNSEAKTLYCDGSSIGCESKYTYVYFEFYGYNVCAYGTTTLNASTSNLAHFYQQVTA